MRPNKLLFLVFLSSTLAAIDLTPPFLRPQHSGGLKRQVTQCTRLVCGTEGSACANQGVCEPCRDAFYTCSALSFGNMTAICDCYLTRTQCYNNIGTVCGEEANNDREDCLREFANQPGICSCGAVSPVLQVSNVCPFPSTGCSIAGRCVARRTSGPCAGSNDDSICGDPSDSNIFSSSNYNCQNGTAGYQCTKDPQDLGGANDYCNSAADCVEGIPCNGGRCQGKGPGAPCDNDDACAFGLYCSGQICVPHVPAGGNCTIGRCANDYTCSVNRVCIADYSVPVGGLCSSSSNCVLGSFCANGVAGTRICRANPARTTCTTDQDCDGGSGSCECFLDGNKYCEYGGVPGCFQEIQNLLSCLNGNQCSSGFGGPQSCGNRLCSNEIRCYTDCYLNLYAGSLRSCYAGDLTCESGAGILVVGWILSALLILAL